MITFASRVKLWKRATGGCFVGCLESEEGNLDRIKFEEKFFLPPGPLGWIDWDTLRVLLSFVDYRRIHREPQEASEFSLLKFSFTNIPCMINDISVAKPFSQSRAAQEVALLDTANLFVLGNKWKLSRGSNYQKKLSIVPWCDPTRRKKEAVRLISFTTMKHSKLMAGSPL